MANFFSNIKNVKGNWRTIQSSPYASLVFRYKITKATIIVFCLFIAWQIYSIIINYSGSGYMSWITRGFTLVIGIIIISKAWETLAPLKRAMEPYEKNKKLINHTNTDPRQDIDSILNDFDKEGVRINNQYKEEIKS